MTRGAILVNLLAYSLVVSQPLFYLVAMTSAQHALSAPAYIELRQSINSVMTRRISWIYLGALVMTLLLIVLSFLGREWLLLGTTVVSLLCLGADIVFMLRENLPINGVIDQWSPTNYPEDWETYRMKWFSIFGYRQVLLLVGFFSLLIGAVFQT